MRTKAERRAVQGDLLMTPPEGVYHSAHGFPSPGEEHKEGPVDPYEWVVRRGSATFWFAVGDDSLIDLGILPGDLLAFDRAVRRRVGDIAMVDHQGERLVGVLGKGRGELAGRYVLRTACSANPMRPVPFTPDTEVFGIAIGQFRAYRD